MVYGDLVLAIGYDQKTFFHLSYAIIQTQSLDRIALLTKNVQMIFFIDDEKDKKQ